MIGFRKLIVMDRSEAATMAPPPIPWAVISIRGTGDKPVEFPDGVSVLHLLFDDIDRVEEGLTAFSIKTAEQVWDFVDRVWDTAEVLMVHCLLGACRSPGVAAAISKVKYGYDQFWFQRRTPNRRVYRAMMKVAYDRGLL